MPRAPAADAVAGVVENVIEAIRTEPLVAAVVVGGAILLFGAIALIVRRLRRRPGQWLSRTLAGADTVTVLMHPNPDPDAMASALGVAAIAERAGTEAVLQHPGEIRHQENRAFRVVLDVECESIDGEEDLAGDEVVLVDHNEPRGFEGASRIRPLAVVDHHPGGGEGAAFTDVRPQYGACASIIAEYLDDLGLDPGLIDEAPESEAAGDDSNGTAHHDSPGLSQRIATGLLYGILSDTSNLTRGCSQAEFDASAYLYPGIDEDALDRVANPPVDAEVLDVIARAISNREVRGPFAVSDVGGVSNVDAIPQAADELLRLEGITAVVVMGVKDDELHLSGRSRDDRVHMGEALATAVEDISMSEAGGHARMGGGQVSLPHMEGLRQDSGITRSDLNDRVFGALGGEA